MSPMIAHSPTTTHRSAVSRRVREKKVRSQGRKQYETRRAQVRPKRGAFFKDLLAELSEASYSGNVKRAEKIFKDLTSLEVEFVVDTRTINKIILAAAHGGEVAKATQWFEDLGYVYNLEPDVSVFTSVITAGAKYGNLSFAEQWFEAMEFYQIQPDVATYGAVIQAASNAKDLPAAERWLRKMQHAGLQPNAIIFNLATRLQVPQGSAKRSGCQHHAAWS